MEERTRELFADDQHDAERNKFLCLLNQQEQIIICLKTLFKNILLRKILPLYVL